MDVTFERADGMRQGDSLSRKSDVKESVNKMRAAGSQEVNDLIADVEELVGCIGESGGSGNCPTADQGEASRFDGKKVPYPRGRTCAGTRGHGRG